MEQKESAGILNKRRRDTNKQESFTTNTNGGQRADRKRETLLSSPGDFRKFLEQATGRHGRERILRDVVKDIDHAIKETSSRIDEEQALLTEARRQAGIDDNTSDSVSINDLQAQKARLEENMQAVKEFFGAGTALSAALGRTHEMPFAKGEKSLEKFKGQLNELADRVVKLISIFRQRESGKLTQLIEPDKLSLLNSRANALRLSLDQKEFDKNSTEFIRTLRKVGDAINSIGEISSARNKTIVEDIQSLLAVRAALDDINLFIDGITHQDIDSDIKKVLRFIADITIEKKNFLIRKMNALAQYQK